MSPFPDQGTKLKTVVVITFALYSEKTDVSDGVRVARSFQLPTGTAKVAKSLDGWLHPVLRHPAGEQRQYCIIARSFSVERCLFFQFVKFEAFSQLPGDRPHAPLLARILSRFHARGTLSRSWFHRRPRVYALPTG
jgi:hypothetical protein